MQVRHRSARRDGDGKPHPLSKQFGRTVDLDDVPENARLQRDTVKAEPVALYRGLGLCATDKIVPDVGGQLVRLNGSDQFAEIIRGVKFVNGERQDRAAA